MLTHLKNQVFKRTIALLAVLFSMSAEAMLSEVFHSLPPEADLVGVNLPKQNLNIEIEQIPAFDSPGKALKFFKSHSQSGSSFSFDDDKKTLWVVPSKLVKPSIWKNYQTLGLDVEPYELDEINQPRFIDKLIKPYQNVHRVEPFNTKVSILRFIVNGAVTATMIHVSTGIGPWAIVPGLMVGVSSGHYQFFKEAVGKFLSGPKEMPYSEFNQFARWYGLETAFVAVFHGFLTSVLVQCGQIPLSSITPQFVTAGISEILSTSLIATLVQGTFETEVLSVKQGRLKALELTIPGLEDLPEELMPVEMRQELESIRSYQTKMFFAVSVTSVIGTVLRQAFPVVGMLNPGNLIFAGLGAYSLGWKGTRLLREKRHHSSKAKSININESQFESVQTILNVENPVELKNWYEKATIAQKRSAIEKLLLKAQLTQDRYLFSFAEGLLSANLAEIKDTSNFTALHEAYYNTRDGLGALKLEKPLFKRSSDKGLFECLMHSIQPHI